MSRKKLAEMKQTDGKVESFNYTTLDQVFGDTGLSKYGTLDVNKYKESLADMTKADLREHSVKIGIIPVDDREQMEKKLLKEFMKYASTFQKPLSVHPDKRISKEVLKILAEGR